MFWGYVRILRFSLHIELHGIAAEKAVLETAIQGRLGLFSCKPSSAQNGEAREDLSR